MGCAAHNLGQGLKNVQKHNIPVGKAAGMSKRSLGTGQTVFAANGDENCLVHGVPWVCGCAPSAVRVSGGA